MKYDLQTNNNFIVVTGANGDIGRSICERLSADGYKTIGFSRDKKRKVPVDYSFTFDIRDEQEIVRAFKGIQKITPHIFGLVNNAGVYPIVRLEEYTRNLWDEVMAINLTAVFYCTRCILPFMKSRGGAIINISSTGAHLGSRDPGYAASKAGLLGFTKSCARNLGKYNIRVNAVAPGTVDTRMSKRMAREDRQKNLDTMLIKRLGSPSDISGAVSFFLSKDAEYITGFTLDVNGGLYIR